MRCVLWAVMLYRLRLVCGQIRTHRDPGVFSSAASAEKICTSFHAGCQSSWDLYLTGNYGGNSISYLNPGLYQESLRSFFRDRTNEPPIDLTQRIYDTILYSPWMQEDHPQLVVMVFLFQACYMLPLDIAKGNELFRRSQFVYDGLPRAAKSSLKAWSYHQAKHFFFEVSSTIRPLPSRLSSVEFVIAFCRESIDWLLDIDMPRARVHIVEVCNAPGRHAYVATGIHDAHPGWLSRARKAFVSVRTTRVLKDTSRESLAYAQHVFENYESIADFTIFLQGNPWDHVDIFQLQQVLKSLRVGSYNARFLHLGEHYEMAVVDECMNNMYRVLFNTTCDVCRWGCQTLPCSGCQLNHREQTHCFQQTSRFVDDSRSVCSNPYACKIDSLKAFASYANNMFVARKDSVVRKSKHWWGLVYDLLGERTLEASQFGCIAVRDKPNVDASMDADGHGSGTLAITFEWLWHVVFGEDIIMPRRSHNGRLPLFLRGPDTNRFQASVPTTSKRLQARYTLLTKHLSTIFHLSQPVKGTGRVSSPALISSCSCFDDAQQQANLCNLDGLTTCAFTAHGNSGPAIAHADHSFGTGGIISARSKYLPTDAQSIILDACCSSDAILLYPDPGILTLTTSHPSFESGHHTWEVQHAPYMYKRTIKLDAIENNYIQSLTLFDWMFSAVLAVQIDQRSDGSGNKTQLPMHACVIDVGAGIGLFALETAARHPTSTILAIEPNAVLFRQLTMNVHRNGLTHQIFPINAALCHSGSHTPSVDLGWWQNQSQFGAMLDGGVLGSVADCFTLSDVWSYAALAWERWQSGRRPMPGEISLVNVDCGGCEYYFLSRSRSSNSRLLHMVIDKVEQWSGAVSDHIFTADGWLSWRDAASAGHILRRDRSDVVSVLCEKQVPLSGCGRD